MCKDRGVSHALSFLSSCSFCRMSVIVSVNTPERYHTCLSSVGAMCTSHWQGHRVCDSPAIPAHGISKRFHVNKQTY
jgi:hypothetical protein